MRVRRGRRGKLACMELFLAGEDVGNGNAGGVYR